MNTIKNIKVAKNRIFPSCMITEFAKMQRPFRQNCRNRIDFDKNFDKFEPFGQLPASSPADQSSQVHIDLDKIIQLGSIP